MKSKVLSTICKRLIVIALLIFVSTLSWGQESSSLTGSGTEIDPYVISSADDWRHFASDVNGGYSYTGEFVKLNSDITIDCVSRDNMVGNRVENTYYSFKGTFDGDNYTLTFNYDYTPLASENRLDYVAPFRYINGATIKNLNVDGEIKMNKHNAGGLFCVNDIDEDSKSNITSCTVSANIIGYKDYCGGFANDAKNTTFTDCIYKGRLNIGRYSGGFSARGNNKTIVNNCLCAPAAESEIYSGSGNFVNNKDAKVSANCYFTLMPNTTPVTSITDQGTMAYTTEPTEPGLFTKYQALIDGKNYYVEGNATITDLPYAYTYTGSLITVNYGLEFNGEALTEGDDFAATIDPAIVQDKGNYTLTITGAGSYHGTLSQTFDVIEGLTGEGTAGSPYLIYSASDWEIFTENINEGLGAEAYYKLVNNITVGSAVDPISTIVGVDGHPFSGHFDGDFHTLEIYINRTENYAAPFGIIYGATIENLAVKGTVTSNKKYLAGIAAIANYLGSEERTNNITNCISSVDIYCNANGDCSTGGLLGQNEKGEVNFTNCIFDGTINGNSGGTTQKCGGFVNWNGGTINYNHCAMAGQIINVSSNKATFNRNKIGVFTTGTISYYWFDYGGVPSSDKVRQAATDVGGLGLCGKYTLGDPATTYYYPGGIITGDFSTAAYSLGETVTINPTITYYGWTLEEGTGDDLNNKDYKIVYEYRATVEEQYEIVSGISGEVAGHYRISIVGTKNYGGSIVIYEDLEVISLNSWPNLKRAMAVAKADLTLTQDLTDTYNDGALVVSGTIVLDLNGHIINRNKTAIDDDGYVIKVEAGASLTINDSNPSATHTGDFASLTGGIITGGYNNGDGGGIYNDRGTLTLNNVTVYNNKCKWTGGGIYCAEKSDNKSSRFYMNGGAIRNNEAVGESGVAAGGGGIYANMAAAFQMDNVAVTGNRTISKGGGIRIKMSTNNITINGCTITNNVIGTDSESKGGGIYYDANTNDSRTLTITDCEICANTVTKEGGGIYALRGTVELNNCILAENSAGTIGGGVCIYGSGLIVNGGEIKENTSANQGGGVYMYSGKTMQIKGAAQIIGNTSTATTAENVYFAGSSDVIGVLDDITGAKIGVSRTNNGAITSVLGSYGTEKNFIADDGAKWVLLYEGKAYLQNYYIWGVTEGWPELEGVEKVVEAYEITAVVDIPNGTTVAPPTTVTLEGASMLIVEDGGQLNSSTALSPVIVKKDIAAADDAGASTYGWYTIASPVNNANILTGTNLVTMDEEDPTFDLLRYNENKHFWESYLDNEASHGSFTSLDNGRGYMYRNANDVTVEFEGTIQSSAVNYAVTCRGEYLTGFNLIGNPFTHNITLDNVSLSAGDALTGGYILDKAGAWGSKLAVDAKIAPCQGVLVQVTADATATISHTASKSRATKEYVQFTVANNSYEDVAYALFEQGHGLGKISHENPRVPMIYIDRDNEDYAIATMGVETKSFDLNFEAKTMGRYTLSVNPQGRYRYLHLYDKLSEKDIDLLSVREYSFIGSPTDNADRFIVRIEHADSPESTVFAYQNGNAVFVSGDGALRVFDVLGRYVMGRTVNGGDVINTDAMAKGVYILRLNGKSQRIVVR